MGRFHAQPDPGGPGKGVGGVFWAPWVSRASAPDISAPFPRAVLSPPRPGVGVGIGFCLSPITLGWSLDGGPIFVRLSTKIGPETPPNRRVSPCDKQARVDWPNLAPRPLSRGSRSVYVAKCFLEAWGTKAKTPHICRQITFLGPCLRMRHGQTKPFRS